MTKEAMRILEDMIKEYELRAKYNGGRDYQRYSVLLDICKELKEKEERRSGTKWKKYKEAADGQIAK